MSGEVKASHARPAAPFPLADDFIDEDESPPKPMTLNRLGRMMAEGFNHMNARIDALATRVETVESTAQWKVYAVKFLKLAGPALVGAVAARFPEAAKLLGALLTGVQ